MFRKLLCAVALLLPVNALATDLSITAANVKPLAATTQVGLVRVGEAVTAGQPLYKKTSDNKYYKAQSDGTAEEATVACIASSAASTDGYCFAVVSGEMDLGATLTVGAQYLCSDTAGGIYPEGDVATGEYISSLGVAVTTSKFIVNIKNTGYEAP